MARLVLLPLLPPLLLAACTQAADTSVALDLCELDEVLRHECVRGLSQRERDQCVARAAPQALRVVGGIPPQCREPARPEGIELQ